MTPDEKIKELKRRIDELLDENIALQNDIIKVLVICEGEKVKGTNTAAIDKIYDRLQK